MVVTEEQRNREAPKSKTGASAKPTSDVLVEAIPTEVLAPYTAIITVIVANAKAGEWEVGVGSSSS